MAQDIYLLESGGDQKVQFRHYEWEEPTVTFGYFQKYDEVSSSIPEGFQCCRRPTGGGIVDHSDDWTYTVIIPPTHSLFRAPAKESYKTLHEALANALRKQGVEASLQPCERCGAEKSLSCFTLPSAFDVVNESNGVKIAGAAQKRSKHGLLTQGSINKSSAGLLNWDQFHTDFTQEISKSFGTKEPQQLSEFTEIKRSSLIDKIKDSSWNRLR